MGMRIANNIAAMNAHRWLGVSDTGLSKSLERLSSGYRINHAADDAAGLAISEGFRADIASFKVASRNTSEASSLLQVAEGGMDQIGNMLTRLKELATQAASANVGSSERTKIDAEADQLITEIDRIANSTKYGSTALLDGTFGASQTGSLQADGTNFYGIIDDTNDNIAYKVSSAAGKTNTGATVTALGSDLSEDSTWYIAVVTAGTTGYKIANDQFSAATISEFYSSATLTDTTLTFSNLGVTITLTGAANAQLTTVSDASALTDASKSALTFERTGLTSLNVENANTGTYTISDSTDTGIKIYGPNNEVIEEQDWQQANQTITFSQLGVSFKLSSDYSYTTGELNGMTFTVSANTDASGNTFQIGAENNSNNQIAISIDGVRTSDLSIDSIDLSTASNAQSALDSIDSAISTLAGSRGDIGAYMNRLAYASANLATTIENTQAAESVIRDVDMAMEMTSFTKNQILLQAGTAMLAQANMAPQQVLALFG